MPSPVMSETIYGDSPWNRREYDLDDRHGKPARLRASCHAREEKWAGLQKRRNTLHGCVKVLKDFERDVATAWRTRRSCRLPKSDLVARKLHEKESQQLFEVFAKLATHFFIARDYTSRTLDVRGANIPGAIEGTVENPYVLSSDDSDDSDESDESNDPSEE
ncbi:hypothetical protein BDU57DRAFT_536339 [Ampelomyces quisqualis]|uniref:Uncharacterized protein n=1 Tax=Ampelomyces quisqualis TaxID=50730 RepID=A0A6A5QV43_AMPQU|nr:hypothetical protein BDU57DRAFT_536339 [Ampelomyces quisqualis]